MNTEVIEIKTYYVTLDGQEEQYEVRKTLGGGILIFGEVEGKYVLLQRFDKAEVSVTDTMDSLFNRWVERNPYELTMRKFDKELCDLPCCEFDCIAEMVKKVQGMLGRYSSLPFKDIVECVEDKY